MLSCKLVGPISLTTPYKRRSDRCFQICSGQGFANHAAVMLASSASRAGHLAGWKTGQLMQKEIRGGRIASGLTVASALHGQEQATATLCHSSGCWSCLPPARLSLQEPVVHSMPCLTTERLTSRVAIGLQAIAGAERSGDSYLDESDALLVELASSVRSHL